MIATTSPTAVRRAASSGITYCRNIFGPIGYGRERRAVVRAAQNSHSAQRSPQGTDAEDLTIS